MNFLTDLCYGSLVYVSSLDNSSRAARNLAHFDIIFPRYYQLMLSHVVLLPVCPVHCENIASSKDDVLCQSFAVIFFKLTCFDLNKPTTGYASQHIWCLFQARINWVGCSRKGIRHKNGGNDGGGSLISPDGVALSQIAGVSAFVIFPCTTKSRRFLLLAPADLDSLGKRAIKQFCVF